MNDKTVKEIIKIKNQIRQKYKALKSGQIRKEGYLKDTFKPITEPLQELLKNVKEKPKLELKQRHHTYKRKIGDHDEEQQRSEKYKKMKRKLSFLSDTDDEEDPFEAFTKDSTEEQQQQQQPSTSKEMQGVRKKTTLFNSNPGDLALKYLNLYIDDNGIDKTYGAYYDEDSEELMIGNSTVNIREDDLIIDGQTYQGTPGLYELIFMHRPKRYMYDDIDLANYEQILNNSSAFHRGFNKSSQIRGNRSYKYKYIIKHLIPKHKGGELMQLSDRDIDYIYWNDPNELVDRLRLLIASQQAGNNSHNNEIVSIIEELREANIIV